MFQNIIDFYSFNVSINFKVNSQLHSIESHSILLVPVLGMVCLTLGLTPKLLSQ